MTEQPRLARQNGIIAGVCGEIAFRFGWSPQIIRIIFFVILLPGGLPGLLQYPILWILMPKRQD